MRSYIRTSWVVRLGALVVMIAIGGSHRANNAEAVKGIRALVFSGETLRDPVRVGDFDEATGLYLRFRGGRTMPVDSAAVIAGRRCIMVSAFMANARNMNIPLDQLPAGRGDFNYRLYLFPVGERPVMAAGNGLWRINTDVAQEFLALGVPVADSANGRPDCN